MLAGEALRGAGCRECKVCFCQFLSEYLSQFQGVLYLKVA